MGSQTVFAQVGPLLADFNKTTPQSKFVGFFHNYPRWIDTNNFSLTTKYYLSIGLLAVPYVVFGVLFILAVLIANACLRKRKDDRVTAPPMGKAGVLGASATYLLAFVCLGIGLVANDSFHNYVKAINQVIGGFIDDLGVTGLGVLNFVTDAEKNVLNDNFAKQFSELFRGLLEPLDRSIDMARVLSQQVAQGIQDARNVISGVDKAITWVYAGLIIVLAFLFIGLVLLFTSSIRGNVKRRIAKAIYLMPLLLAWITVGIATSTGGVLGDMCVTVADYQKQVLVDKDVLPESTMNGMNMNNNAMANSQLTCPQNVVPGGEEQLRVLSKAIEQTDSILKTYVNSRNSVPEPIATLWDTIEQQIVTGGQSGRVNSTVEELSRAVSWVVNRKQDFLNCNQLAELLARLNAYLCGPRQTIMVVFSIWLALLFLSILLSIMLILASFTRFNPAMIVTPRWVASERGTYVLAKKKLVSSPSEFSPYFNASAPAPP